ncbi:copper chaperone PCu(A)C [Campylobacter sp. MIT 21-1685]|uniref:copper chaperone PCu(A)C n=1 Tax=unclassified Campylobacter TaxID=2593542 RepID=UPI00224ABCC4|nr:MULTISPECIES: copper chaperone PCu(A)C [unclassified Campylobacter]MCX2682819.1 copper chaperone PCu(A)C [Campylobacter sp. MIT 21-1684]MCX2751035.1 copper chaperone PCu(A)C [Campylobacter sp. MIT 21-1682]MCX2807300.1 copper chaperone PCu(A)C [Campylobacter sp. MIT 21-1685]
MKKMFLLYFVCVLTLFAQDIEIQNASIKKTPPNAKNTAIFLTIHNKSNKDIALVNVQTDLAQATELHTHIHKNNTMVMTPVPEIVIKANSSRELKSGGDHIMLFNIHQRIDKNTKNTVTLFFDTNESIKLENIPVKE